MGYRSTEPVKCNNKSNNSGKLCNNKKTKNLLLPKIYGIMQRRHASTSNKVVMKYYYRTR